MFKKRYLFLLATACIFAGCTNPSQLCQDTALFRTAQINWDEIPTYSGRDCKGSPGQNPLSPLYRAAKGRTKESGSVYIKIQILEECKNDTWYNYYYWQKVWGYHDDILVPVNKPFRLIVEYEENCMKECYSPDLYNSAIFRSTTVIQPGEWSASTAYTLITPTYASEQLACSN